MRYYEKIFNKFSSTLFATVSIITAIVSIQPLAAMKERNIIGSNQDFQIYLLLSSVNENLPCWLPADIIRTIMMHAHAVTELLRLCNFNCNTTAHLGLTTSRLITLYDFCPHMPVALLKICLHNHGKSLFEIKDYLSFTVFDTHYVPNTCEQAIKIWCSTVDRKEFVDHFKKPYDPFNLLSEFNDFKTKTNLLHRYMYSNTNTEVTRLYCNVFLDYAKNSPEKSKEIIKLLEARDNDGHTIVYYARNARNKGGTEMVTIITNTKKELRRNIKKEECVIL